MTLANLNTFERHLQSACRCMVKTLKKDGTVGMGFDCFAQNASHLPYAYGFSECLDAPRGTNYKYCFHESLRKVVTTDKVLSRFVR